MAIHRLPTRPRVFAALCSVAVVLGSLIGTTSPAEAAAPYNCNAAKTECFTYVSKTSSETLVERVKITNNLNTTKHFHCAFSKNASYTWSNSESVTGSVEVTLWGAVGLSLSGTQEKTVSQTASQATDAGFDGDLKPGKTVYCRRFVGYDKVKFTHARSSSSAAITTTVYATVYNDFAIDISATP
jgi:hypothetical protein